MRHVISRVRIPEFDLNFIRMCGCTQQSEMTNIISTPMDFNYVEHHLQFVLIYMYQLNSFLLIFFQV
ncbi:hypothetical protein C1646_725213 [Rhizophagus diaphanus]|nr:hypothetical protein C1646_725213 [Rhizophagus diaphanus] [Rhizophagus sp. MUCL 43196]